MKKVIYILLAFCPSFLHVAMRRLMGQKIGRKTKLKFGTLMLSSKVEIGQRSKIGPFSYVKSDDLKIGNYSMVKPLVILKTRKIAIADYVHIAPTCIITSEFTRNSTLSIGNHSRIFPFCWLDTGEGITIGQNVGVGGHTLMFTHGVWPNYVDGGPISFGPIVIEDNVWLPWRVFILPNVTIGENAIIGGNSLINKDIPARTLAAGSPAKSIKEMEFDSSKKHERLLEVLESFSDYIDFKKNSTSKVESNRLILENYKIVIDDLTELSSGDLFIALNTDYPKVSSQIEKGISILDYDTLTIYKNGNKNKEISVFVSFLRRFGVRLYFD